jgi:Mce-associated membrane protein
MPSDDTDTDSTAVSADGSKDPDVEAARAALPELSSIEEAEAEAAHAEAVAVAAQARARAIRLRREAEAAKALAEAGECEAGAAPDTPAQQPEADAGHDPAGRPRWASLRRALQVRRAGGRTLVAALSMLVIGASASASGTMWWQHRQVEQTRQRSAEFEAAARQGAVLLMSLSFRSAKDDVQRLIDHTSGGLRKDFESTRGDLITAVQNSKVVTTASVKSAAVQSMSADNATVLVAATSTVTEEDGTAKEPHTWRLNMIIARDRDQLTVSRAEFMP